MDRQAAATPRMLAACGAGALLLGAVLFWSGLFVRQTDSPTPDAPAFAVPPIRSSRFLNAKADVSYVGNDACAECHKDEHASYLNTPHSQALQDIALASEPPDAEFHHELSGRSYRVYRRDGRLWHREWIPLVDGEELVLADYPMQYAIGSGHHSRSYLVEVDGFLFESPLTWYASKQAWDMSPGFDRPVHFGFERAADVGCIACHAGRITSEGQSLHRLAIHQAAIGCESCHGPGAVHVSERDAGAEPDGDVDATIVNPAHLERDVSESICAQCHLRAESTVLLRGRDFDSFRPGLPLADFRVDYRLQPPQDAKASSEDGMDVTGHFEQMYQSACYRGSETLSCLTCHDPHFRPAPEGRLAHFRQKCLECHTEDSCGLAHAERLQRDAQDNCVGCHMPQVPTDIPHFAFTHHRIGVHDPDGLLAYDRNRQWATPGELVAVQDQSDLDEIDRKRNLGLAYLELSDKHSGAGDGMAYLTYVDRARDLLAEAYRDGLRDPNVDAALAKIEWLRGFPDVVPLAQSALELDASSEMLGHGMRVSTLFLLGDALLRRGQPAQAEPVLRRLTELRYTSEDWLLLGISLQEQRQTPAAIEAFERAVRINPSRRDIHQILVELYRRTGNTALSEQHARMVRQLPR